jgi:hypothetical protein
MLSEIAERPFTAIISDSTTSLAATDFISQTRFMPEGGCSDENASGA